VVVWSHCRPWVVGSRRAERAAVSEACVRQWRAYPPRVTANAESPTHWLDRCALTRYLRSVRVQALPLSSSPRREYHDGEGQGLYGVRGLREPSDFPRLAASAAAEVEALLACAISGEAQGTIRGASFVAVLDEMSDKICLVMDAAELCRCSHEAMEWKRASMSAYESLASLVARLNMDTKLYQALLRCLERASCATPHPRDKLDQEQLRVAQLLKFDFERGGVHLEDAARDRVMTLQEEIGQLCFQFVDSSSSARPPTLQLPSAVARTLPADLQKRIQWGGQGEAGVVTLIITKEVYHRVMNYIPVEELRKAVYLKEHALSERVVILERILRLRHELAVAIGFPSFAHMSMLGKMAPTPAAARELLDNIGTGLQDKARAEVRVLADIKQELEGGCGVGDEGKGARIESWDKLFYTGEARRRAAALSAAHAAHADVREYLPLSKVLSGIGEVLEQVFGVTVLQVPMTSDESWAPHLSKLLLHMHASSSTCDSGGVEAKHAGGGEHGRVFLGTVYLDLRARAGKVGGAAHYTVQCGRLMPDGVYRAPVVALCCNLNSDPRAKEPLLTHYELETLLHEFGHVLHSVLGRTKYQHLSGTRAVADVVEVPSTLMEYFAYDPSVLKLLSGHYLTKDVIPDEVLAALKAQRQSFAALDMLQQVIYGVADLELHSAHSAHSTNSAAHSNNAADGWSYEIARSAAASRSPIPPAPDTYWYADLSHLASYGANYYSYLWSRAVSALIWRAHFAAQPLRSKAGLPFVTGFLSRGGSRDGHEMVVEVLRGEGGEGGGGGGRGMLLSEDMKSACEALLDDIKV
jgi:mitochondrial intermediate peptidase